MNTLCSLKWDTYTSNVCKGFANLQQRDEFVDMTLAAEGHLVKVHKSLMALASPYLKELIKTVPCQHPVVFLNDVNHENLQYILEYIYTGEVMVPIDKLPVFIRTAKALCIQGLKDFHNPIPNKRTHINDTEETTAKRAKVSHVDDVDNVIVENNINMLPQTAVTNGNQLGNDNFESWNEEPEIVNTTEIVEDFDETITSSNIPNQAALPTITIAPENIQSATKTKDLKLTIRPLVKTPKGLVKQQAEPKLQYKVNVLNDEGENKIQFETLLTDDSHISDTHDKVTSWLQNNEATPMYVFGIRNNIQLILNRFMYFLQHTSTNKKAKSKKRRWRCVSYRDLNCLAYVDTDDDAIVTRKFEHNHTHHDEEIILRGRKATFTSIEEAVKIANHQT